MNESNKFTIKTIKRNVYGRDLNYPACDTSKEFAYMLGVKTLTVKQIFEINNLINCAIKLHNK